MAKNHGHRIVVVKKTLALHYYQKLIIVEVYVRVGVGDHKNKQARSLKSTLVRNYHLTNQSTD